MRTAVSRFTLKCTVVSPSGTTTDEYNNIVDGATVETVIDCHHRPLSSDEVDDSVTEDRRKIYVAPDTSLLASDSIVIDGESWEIVEGPTTRYNPRTRIAETLFAVIERTV